MPGIVWALSLIKCNSFSPVLPKAIRQQWGVGSGHKPSSGCHQGLHFWPLSYKWLLLSNKFNYHFLSFPSCFPMLSQVTPAIFMHKQDVWLWETLDSHYIKSRELTNGKKAQRSPCWLDSAFAARALCGSSVKVTAQGISLCFNPELCQDPPNPCSRLRSWIPEWVGSTSLGASFLKSNS